MRVGWRLLLRWWFVGSVVVLALNDHVLKDAFPGWWTGKLSDVVGPVVVASLLAVLIGRMPAAVLTTVAFLALKTVPGVAEAVAPLLGGVTRRDPSDLLGLVALVPAWRAIGPGRAVAVLPSGATRDRCLAVVSACVALLVATATSYDDPPRVSNVQAEDGAVYAEGAVVYGGGARRDGWARSDDGGRTWTESKRPQRVQIGEFGGTARQDEACGDDRCVRIVDLAVEERVGAGEWTTAFSYSDDDLALMNYRTRTEPTLSDVVVVDAPAGPTFVVATGEDGVLVSGVDGEWRRVAVLDVEPTDLSGTMLFLELVPWAFLVALIAVVFVLLSAMGIPTEPHRRVSGGAIFAALLMAIGFSLLAAVAWGFGTVSTGDPVVHGLVVLGLVASAVALPWLYLDSGRRAGRWNISPP